MPNHNIFEIDINNLFEEWRIQSRLTREVADKHADALKSHREEEARLEVVFADLAQKIRQDPEKFKLNSNTETAIKQIVVMQPAYQKQRQAVIDANYSADIYNGHLKALANKRAGLEKTVEMMLSGLRAEPRMPDNTDIGQVEKLRQQVQGKKQGSSNARKTR